MYCVHNDSIHPENSFNAPEPHRVFWRWRPLNKLIFNLIQLPCSLVSIDAWQSQTEVSSFRSTRTVKTTKIWWNTHLFCWNQTTFMMFFLSWVIGLSWFIFERVRQAGFFPASPQALIAGNLISTGNLIATGNQTIYADDKSLNMMQMCIID